MRVLRGKITRRRTLYKEAIRRRTESWAIENEVPGVRVVTQGENIPACSLYEKNGFLLRWKADCISLLAIPSN